MLPVPISTPGFDNGPYTTSSHFVTRDPETGQYNMRNYRGRVKATDRMGCYAGNFSGLRAHWNKCRSLKKPLEVACVIGVPPNISYAAVARIAPELDEFAVAGAIAGAPVELILCKPSICWFPRRGRSSSKALYPRTKASGKVRSGSSPAIWATRV
jgi:UbiD family decarboxylase